MAPQSHALQQCFNEVISSAPMVLQRCLNHVVSVLQEAESATSRPAERIELSDAWRELLQHQAAWCRSYPDELRAAFNAKVKPKSPAPSAGGSRSAPQGLSLVDDAAIVEAIEASRMVQHVMPLVERPVSELDALVSSAMGLPTIQPELNPVRPEVFAQALRSVIGRTQVKAAGSLWMKHMAEPLGRELQELYGRLVTQLKNANVRAAEYRFMQQSSGDGAGRSSGRMPLEAAANAPAAQAGAAVSYGSLSSQQISHSLLRDFLFKGDGDQASQQPLPASYYAEVDLELSSLKEQLAGERAQAAPAPLPSGYRELPAVERPARAVGVQSTLSTQVWGDYAHSNERSLVRSRLRKDATHVAQVLGLELVRKVVNQVAQDPQLLAPVREAIVALEPSLLRLAMVDPRFFSEIDHPGRRLMEAVAQRSFKYNDEFGTEFGHFFEEIGRSFNALNRSEIESAQPFEDALVYLEETWSEQDRHDQEQQAQMLQAMRFAELRQLEAERIAQELSARTDLAEVPSVVRDFVLGPWSLVLAHAKLTDTRNQIDPYGYRSVISDLLWSVKPEVTLKQPAQLFERVPRLIATLRAGLATLGQAPQDSEPFFQALMQLHRPVLKLRRAKSLRDARESGVAPIAAADDPPDEEQVDFEVSGKRAHDEFWLSPEELSAAGFQETLPSEVADLSAEAADSSPEPVLDVELDAVPASGEPSAQAPEAVLTQLREGDWVDLHSKRRWLRAQLIWASSKATLFMFVSHGGQPHTMTRRICERLIRERYLRPVHTHDVVAQALSVLDQPA